MDSNITHISQTTTRRTGCNRQANPTESKFSREAQSLIQYFSPAPLPLCKPPRPSSQKGEVTESRTKNRSLRGENRFQQPNRTIILIYYFFLDSVDLLGIIFRTVTDAFFC